MFADTRARARILLLVCCGLLGGCVVVDHQYGRSVRYNIEAENAQQQALLLNIIRASLRRPMQFTTLTNLDGDLSVKTSAQWAIPFGPFVGTSNVLTVNSPDYTENASVKVATLDDSSYYNGLLSPVPPQLFDLYIHSGYPREVLFNLFVRKIVIQRLDPGCGDSHVKGCEFTFLNSPSIDVEIDQFQRIVAYLMRLGLTTEHVEAEKSKGKKKKKKKDDDDDDASDTDSDNEYSLCFAPATRQDQQRVTNSVCAGPRGRARIAALRRAAGSSDAETSKASGYRKEARIGLSSMLEVELEPQLIADLQAIARDEDKDQQRGEALARELGSFAGRLVAVTVYTRSTQNIIYFLGELVRRQNDPEFGFPARIMQVVAVPRGSVQHERHRCLVQPAKFPCRNLFVVNEGLLAGSPALSTSYEGRSYHIVEDREGSSSTQVFDLAKQLFAVKIKADKLPRTTTISVTR